MEKCFNNKKKKNSEKNKDFNKKIIKWKKN